MCSLPISHMCLPVLIGYGLKPNKQSSSSRTNTTLGTLILLGALMSLGGLSVAAPVTRLVSTQAGTEPELLEPERAFQLSARKKDSKTIELQYRIADGYYMYRGRFKFAVADTSLAKVGKPTFSPGKLKLDPTFGRVVIYRNSVRILLPVASLRGQHAVADAQPIRLNVTSQGCADVGVCYPPLHQSITLRPNTTDLTLPDDVTTGASLSESLILGRGSVVPSVAYTLKKSD